MAISSANGFTWLHGGDYYKGTTSKTKSTDTTSTSSTSSNGTLLTSAASKAKAEKAAAAKAAADAKAAAEAKAIADAAQYQANLQAATARTTPSKGEADLRAEFEAFKQKLDTQYIGELSEKYSEARQKMPVDETYGGADGIGTSQEEGVNTFVLTMAQYSDSFISTAQSLSQYDESLDNFKQQLATATTEQQKAELGNLVSQNQAIVDRMADAIKGDLRNIKSLAEQYGVESDTKRFFTEYTKHETGEGLDLNTIYQMFEVS